MGKNKFDLISIVGPTATGKTKLAIKLAKIFSGEIISADSMQIYKEFDILSAAPSEEEMKFVVHHLIKCIPISEEFSVAEFTKKADEALNYVVSNGHVPILVGGTGLYVDSFLKGIDFSDSNAYNIEKRAKLEACPNEKLMEILSEIDEVSAIKIHINDKKRLVRAIEFFYSEGYPISEHDMASRMVSPKYNAFKIGLTFKDRDKLYKLINKRVDVMFKSGILEEVKRVSGEKISKTASAAIGYKELLPYINSDCTLLEAQENLKRATRRYAKRQLTWFRRDKEINWINIDDFENFDEVVNFAVDLLKKQFSV